MVADWETGVKTGRIIKTNTIEELAEKFDLDTDTLKATINRYKGFCEKGMDEDFFKRQGLLIPVTDRPSYGHSSDAPILLVVCGGLRTNIKMQVLNKENQVIPGLYAIGTIVGDMFANYYAFMLSGIKLGATCLTFPYLVGKELAEV